MPKLRISLSDDNEILHELTEDTLTIGRVEDNGLRLDDGSVSSHHAEIVNEGGVFKVRDLGSTNGTFVNESQVTEAKLKGSDVIRFGSVVCRFEADAASAGGAAQPLPQTERAAASFGGSGGRPANFVTSSPFPKPVPKPDALTYAAIAIAVIGALAALAAAGMVFTLTPPV
jgi:FOG: FHA domain